jgi:uncharacterized protein
MDNIGIIDAHVHIFSENVASQRENFFHDSGFKLLFENKKARIATKQDLLEAMEFDGVEKSFCLGFPWFHKDDCQRENDYILESASGDNRLIPFASVPFNQPEKITHFVENCARDGFSGIGEVAFYVTGFDDKQEQYLDNLFATCQEEDMSVILHVNEPVGHKYAGKYITPFSRLITIIERYPGCRVMLSHWGGGLFVYELMPEIKKIFENVWYDTAASIYLYDKKIFDAGIESAGVNKIVFGSDYPLTRSSHYLKQISFLTKSQKHKIIRENALQFLGYKELQ